MIIFNEKLNLFFTLFSIKNLRLIKRLLTDFSFINL